MDEIYEMLLERNIRETVPFVPIHEAYGTLWNQVDAMGQKAIQTDRELVLLRQHVHELEEEAATSTTSTMAGRQDATTSAAASMMTMMSGGRSSSTTSATTAAATAAIRNENRLREKLERLQDDYNARLVAEANEKAQTLKVTQELANAKETNATHVETISHLRENLQRTERAVEHLDGKVKDATSRMELAEKQYDGLKETIRGLQDENEVLRKESRNWEQRMIKDKAKIVEEMNKLSDLVESLQKENQMLKSYKTHEDRGWGGWFGKGRNASGGAEGKQGDAKSKGEDDNDQRKFGSLEIVVPTEPKHMIAMAHGGTEGTSVHYNAVGTDLVATSGSDSTVKVWDTKTGTMRATLRGSTGHTFLACDMSGHLVVGAGSDKTCRVWDLRSERMIHQLVGHQHKITCVRLYNSEKSVITGSADRCLKVWDISRQTYKQTVTLRHSSTANAVDVVQESMMAATGHTDGGLRFWDLKSGDRMQNLSGMHEGGITSVQFHPTDKKAQVLTSGLDGCIKLVDIQTGTPIHTFRHPELRISRSWSRAVTSPDGQYIATGSDANSVILIWNASDGSLRRKLSGQHATSVVGIDWSSGGTTGQQVASIDRKGGLILWA